MKRLTLILFSFLIYSSLTAQNSSDALRYSRIFYDGSARFQGLAGAFGAVGADFSVTATNPAGIGLYKSAEFTFSPSLFINHSSAEYNGNTSVDNKGNFGMGSVGFLFTIPGNANSGLFRSFTVAFGVNRQNDFNRRVYMQGMNNSSSILTDFTNTLNSVPGGISPDMISTQFPFDAGLAYNSYLIFNDSASNSYLSDFDVAPTNHRSVYQTKLVTTKGSINEMDISVGTNIRDVLYIGATIGIPFIRYYENSEYTEVSNDTSIHYFRSLVYDQYLETHGTGINFKLGVIYRPANWVRIGAAIHTPTYYGNMRDNWNSQMQSKLTFIDTTAYSPLGSYDYQMVTPFRAIGSIAFIAGSYGLVSAEYEYVNYNQARFYDSRSGYSDLNKEIKAKYASPVNVRIGTEWRIQDFRIRGGFGYYGSPYQTGISGERYLISGGLGYRGKYFFCDLAYIWSQTKDDYYFYDSSLVNPSSNTYIDHTMVATIGVRF
jgi:hypothetical protein